MAKTKFFKKIGVVSVLIIIVAFLVFNSFYRKAYMSNIDNLNQKSNFLYIPTGSNYDDVLKIIQENNLIKDINSFDWLAKKKNYKNHVHPGRYRLDSLMSNNDLLNKLRSGYQDPVRLVFNNIRTIHQLAGKVSKQIEADSLSLVNLCLSKTSFLKYGFKKETFSCIFLPNTYEFWWNTSADKFIDRMYTEYKRFWNDERKRKAAKLKLTPEEVTTLASIIDEETYFNNEMPRVAGVYINRLRKRMHLQADPTLKFAWGDFTMKRILNKHKEIDSPYNTYKRYGLPPGPISIPSISAIDAVLNYESHDYLYFCAKPDFSGYHNFAKTLNQHNVNARNYQRALNKERIFR